MEKFKIKLVLASGSPRRFELLSHLKIPFEVLTAGINEYSEKDQPNEYAKDIAYQKGNSVLQRFCDMNDVQSRLIVSADTVVALGQKIFEKPKSKEQARIFLEELSNKSHFVYTAVWGFFLHHKQVHTYSFVDRTEVTFEEIDRLLLDHYIDTNDSLDKAGAYGIQGPSLTFVGHINGSYSNVVGFPLSRFVKETDVFFKKFFPGETSWQNMF